MTTTRSVAMATVSACALAFAAPVAIAQPLQQVEELQQFEFDIPAQPLPDALMTLSEQSKQTVLASPQLTEGRKSDAVAGTFTMPQALAEILKSSGLKYRQRDAQTWLVTAQLAEAMGVTSSGVAINDASDNPRLIRVAQVSEADEEEPSADEDEEERPRDEIIVTGTNIRGIAPDSSPTRTFTREDIQISGAGTAQDFIQTLTANFGGGSNADLPVGTPNNSASSQNRGFGSSTNLRGLGSGSTLVLLNGHRLAPSSNIGDFVDISMIPASAIERVEVLTDGASSIYGSDAVAGVVNFILRDDFEGLEASFRYGIGTQHQSAEEFRTGVTGGLNWDSGHALLSYEYFNQDEIGAQDRSFSQGTLLPQDLQPSQERHSVLGSMTQNLTSNLEIFADAVFSTREALRIESLSLGTAKAISTSENLTISAGGTWNATGSWYVDIFGTFSGADNMFDAMGAFPAFSETDSKIWTADIKTSGTALKLPAGALKLAFGGHYRREDFNFSSTTRPAAANRKVYAAFGEAFIPLVGPGNALPGVERLELNVSGRFDDYSDFGSTANPKVGVLWSPVKELRLRGSYSTSFNPPPLGTVGSANNLVVLALQTAPINSLFGFTAADPSIADVVQLYVLGTDNDLDAETSRAFTAGLDLDRQWGHQEISISTTWFDIDFQDRLGTTPIPGNRHVFDAPNIAFNDPGAFPEGTIIFMPSLEEIGEIINRASSLTGNSPPLFGDPFNAAILNKVNVTRNLSRTLVSGLDFDFAYTHHAEIGELVMGVDGTYLLEHKQQAAVTTPVVEQLNTLYNPADLRLRGRLSFVHEGLTTNVFVNYVNDYRVDNTENAIKIDSWTTVDLSLSYDTHNNSGNSIFNDMAFRLSVINLFDEDPPLTPSTPNFGIFGFDPTNASPLGRFIAFELTKQF